MVLVTASEWIVIFAVMFVESAECHVVFVCLQLCSRSSSTSPLIPANSCWLYENPALILLKILSSHSSRGHVCQSFHLQQWYQLGYQCFSTWVVTFSQYSSLFTHYIRVVSKEWVDVTPVFSMKNVAKTTAGLSRVVCHLSTFIQFTATHVAVTRLYMDTWHTWWVILATVNAVFSTPHVHGNYSVVDMKVKNLHHWSILYRSQSRIYVKHEVLDTKAFSQWLWDTIACYLYVYICI